MTTNPNQIERSKFLAEQEKKRLEKSWNRHNKEMDGRAKLRREILERFGPVDPELVKKYRPVRL